MNTYSITLPWPPSNNRYYRHNRGRTHVSAEGQAYRDNVARIIKNAMLDIGLAMPVKIRIECHMPDRRRRDLDNLQKAAFGNDSNLLIVFYVQIMPDDFVMQLHR
ncbi:RusA family crossover junction endodeoxyribonuclease, partial [Escherichia coli]|uniref:RusA family crossover junction endodeoxyribonuclease n=1 Tax=Escherichia coli TaxID=562 RepID=UPI001FCE7A67